MILINEKLEEIYVDLWEPHNLSAKSGNIYAAILISKHTRKT